VYRVSQVVLRKGTIHDNPDSNIHLGRNRRANSVQDGVFNYSGKGDGGRPVRRRHQVRRARVGLVAGRRLRDRPDRQGVDLHRVRVEGQRKLAEGDNHGR
jgi:hypothetical protein